MTYPSKLKKVGTRYPKNINSRSYKIIKVRTDINKTETKRTTEGQPVAWWLRQLDPIRLTISVLELASLGACVHAPNHKRKIKKKGLRYGHHPGGVISHFPPYHISFQKMHTPYSKDWQKSLAKSWGFEKINPTNH